MHNKKVPNRLINEKSPYLLQHAHNPVDWFPWSREAFEKAETEDKPIFLSIGYSTCHWCHVMGEESFEDQEVADVLNRNFVAIKVDKEERPDIDAVYMSVCQIYTGQGGWPTTIIMTPDQKPFFAGTYFPKKAVYGNLGLMEILDEVINRWNRDRDSLIQSGDEIVALLNKRKEKTNEGLLLTKKPIIDAKRLFEKNFDKRYGGFSKSPKFPTPHNLLLLMNIYETEKDYTSLEMVEKTLHQMYRGGIYDHIGGGFSRYSTDEKWLVPHFEKMLYDNALLSMAYTEAYRITEDQLYKQVVKETLDYVLREMTDSGGGFYSAQDADSDGVEGKYYLFNPEEILQVLGVEEGQTFCKEYDITEQGNFEGSNIPNLFKCDNAVIKENLITNQKEKLRDYRTSRTFLHTDDKILTAWNGMMISALARAYKVFEERRYLDAAENAVTFIQTKLTKKDGSLMVRYRKGEGAGNGFLDDYAYFIWGLIELYQVSFKVMYLQNALDLNYQMIKDFWDKDEGGFFLTSNESEPLIYRPKETYDGATPSGNSVAAYNLVRLLEIMGDDSGLKNMAERQLQFLNKEIVEYPAGHSFSLLALSQYLKDR